MNRTGISWADMTWNPLRGCSRISEGCTNCYAEASAARNSQPGGAYDGLAYYATIKHGMKRRRDPRWTGVVRLVPKNLPKPLSRTKPQRIFTCSMSDLFHERVPAEWIDKVFAVMALASQHTFIIITKRAERLRNYLADPPEQLLARWKAAAIELKLPGMDLFAEQFSAENFPLSNVWLMVSAENRRTARDRVPLLLDTPAARRGVSYEPALEWVDFTSLGPYGDGTYLDALAGQTHLDGVRVKPTPRLDWLIVGGESQQTPDRREFVRRFDLVYARRSVEKCKAAGVPVFVKQMGAKPLDSDRPQHVHALVLRHPRGEDPTEWPSELRVHEWPDKVEPGARGFKEKLDELLNQPDDPSIDEAAAVRAVLDGAPMVKMGPPRQAGRIARAALRLQAAQFGLPDPSPPGSAHAEAAGGDEVEGIQPYPEVVSFRFSTALMRALVERLELESVVGVMFRFPGGELVATPMPRAEHPEEWGEKPAWIAYQCDGPAWRDAVASGNPTVCLVSEESEPAEFGRAVSFGQDWTDGSIVIRFERTDGPEASEGSDADAGGIDGAPVDDDDGARGEGSEAGDAPR